MFNIGSYSVAANPPDVKVIATIRCIHGFGCQPPGPASFFVAAVLSALALATVDVPPAVLSAVASSEGGSGRHLAAWSNIRVSAGLAPDSTFPKGQLARGLNSR
jgi:hypothetical protein